MNIFVPPIVVAAEPQRPEPQGKRRASKSAPLPTDPLGLLLEEWLAEQKVRNTYDGE